MSEDLQIEELREIQRRAEPHAWERIMAFARNYSQKYPRRDPIKLRLIVGKKR